MATHFPSEFCAESGAVVDGEYREVDRDFIEKVMNGEQIDGLPEIYEGVVIHFPEYVSKNHIYTSCKVINKKYDALI